MFIRNHNVFGKRYNTIFGVFEIADGLVRILTLGFFRTDLTNLVATKFAKMYFNRMGR